MHNLVNKETGKLPLSYDDALNLIYNNFETKQVKFDKQSTPSVPVSTPTTIKTKDTNIEFKKSKVVQDDGNTFGYFSLLLIIFVILVTIAII